MLRLDPPIPMFVKDKGYGLAQICIDNGIDHDLQWVVFLHDDGRCWTARNSEITAVHNETIGRILTKKEEKNG